MPLSVMRYRPEFSPNCHRIPCAMPLRRIYSIMAQTYVWCRCCSAIVIYLPPRFIPMWHRYECSSYTRPIIHGLESDPDGVNWEVRRVGMFLCCANGLFFIQEENGFLRHLDT